MWIWLVLLYGILKGAREICKKKALVTCTSIEVLLIYTAISFLMVCPLAPQALGLETKYYFYIAFKSFVIFVAWICSFKAIKNLPLSLYGVLDLSRVLFATSLGVIVLGEHMGAFNIIGLLFVCAGLLMLKLKPQVLLARISGKENVYDIDGTDNKAKETDKVSPVIVIIALVSCMLNAVSGLMDKILMKDISSAQLQFWYMLFLLLYYVIYAAISKAQVNIKRAITNKWIWILALMFVIADRALFIANGMEGSQITVMTLIKQAGCIVTILAGRFIFKEKNTGYKMLCAGVIIAGIVMGVL